MGEAWTQEEFEDFWYGRAPTGALGVTLPCDCGDAICHGWKMKVTHLPPPLTLFKEGELGVITMPISVPPLHAGETVVITRTWQE